MAQKFKKQPIPETGYTFTGWAIFNWGHSHDRVFRTRREAINHCLEHCRPSHMETVTWKEMRKWMYVAKVKCTVIKQP